MTKISVKLQGDKELIAKLHKVMKETPKHSEEAMLQSLLYLQSQTPPYPPQRPGNTYRRTGTLGRSVTSLAANNPNALTKVKTFTGGVEGLWGTRVKYAPEVIGRDTQRENTRGYWWTLEGVAEKAIGGVSLIWEKMLGKLVNS